MKAAKLIIVNVNVWPLHSCSGLDIFHIMAKTYNMYARWTAACYIIVCLCRFNRLLQENEIPHKNSQACILCIHTTHVMALKNNHICLNNYNFDTTISIAQLCRLKTVIESTQQEVLIEVVTIVPHSYLNSKYLKPPPAAPARWQYVTV